MSWRALAALALVCWGAVAFGAVYPWAYLPLFAASGLVGAAGIAGARHSAPTPFVLTAALVLTAAAIAVQLIPLPVAALRTISPGTDSFLRQYTVGYVIAGRHALSIVPAATVKALTAVCALALLLVGLSRALTHADAEHLARGIGALGACVAIAAIVQKAVWNGKIYGVWTPLEGGNPFGPFVNRNHYAGWMLMALPLALGYFWGRVTRELRDARHGSGARMRWLASASASETVLLGFGVAVMAVSLMLSMSRSGIVGLFLALIIAGWWIARRQASGSMRAFLGAYLGFVALAAVVWVGVDTLAVRFTANPDPTLGGRVEIWRDTWHIVREFPVTGTGLDTYGTAMLAYQTAALDKHFAEAHNDYLQLLAEGGLLVCVPATIALVAFGGLVWRRVRDASAARTGYWIRAGAVTGMLAIAFQELGDFSLQMPGNAVLFVVLAALAIRPSTDDRRPRVRADHG